MVDAYAAAAFAPHMFVPYAISRYGLGLILSALPTVANIVSSR